MECARPTATPSLLEKVWARIDLSVYSESVFVNKVIMFSLL